MDFFVVVGAMVSITRVSVLRVGLASAQDIVRTRNGDSNSSDEPGQVTLQALLRCLRSFVCSLSSGSVCSSCNRKARSTELAVAASSDTACERHCNVAAMR